MNLEAAWNTYCRIPLPWVRTLGPDYWEQQKVGDTHGPEKYRQLQPESYVMLVAIANLVTTKASLLDVGCNGGRHLRALRRRGFTEIYGMDVRHCAERKTMQGTFEALLPATPDRFYDIVFSFGMTLELVPPSFPICHHLARIAGTAVVLVLQERGVPYPRLWQQEFAREGFTCTRYDSPIIPGSAASLFVFERQP